MRHVSIPGLVLAGLFLLVSGYLVATQGLFGESFVALILGLPWVLGLAYFEFFNPDSEALLYFLVLLPIIINSAVLYGIGYFVELGISRAST